MTFEAEFSAGIDVPLPGKFGMGGFSGTSSSMMLNNVIPTTERSSIDRAFNSVLNPINWMFPHIR